MRRGQHRHRFPNHVRRRALRETDAVEALQALAVPVVAAHEVGRVRGRHRAQGLEVEGVGPEFVALRAEGLEGSGAFARHLAVGVGADGWWPEAFPQVVRVDVAACPAHRHASRSPDVGYVCCGLGWDDYWNCWDGVGIGEGVVLAGDHERCRFGAVMGQGVHVAEWVVGRFEVEIR